jgi:hypothetical protein
MSDPRKPGKLMSSLKGPSSRQVSSYVELFKASVNSYYREAIYYMYQPRSVNAKLGIIFCMSYLFYCIGTYHNRKFSEAYKRKRLRMLEIQNSNMPSESREEWEITQECASYLFPR